MNISKVMAVIESSVIKKSICCFLMGFAMLGHKRLNERGLKILNQAYQTIDVKTSYSSKYVKKALEVTLNNENGLKAIFGAD